MWSWFEDLTKGIGDTVNNVTGATGANQFTAEEAEKQRNWEEYMSNTAYQRAIEDMKAAGINPAMLYQSGGQGASTPSGASAAGQKGSISEIIGSTANLVNAVTNARNLDRITRRNEIKAWNADALYKIALKYARNQQR